MAPEDNSLEKGYEGSAYDSSLESASPVVSSATTGGSGFGHKRLSPFRYNKMAFLVTGIAMAIILLVGGGSVLLTSLKGNKADQANIQKADKYSVGSLSVNGVKGNSQLQVGEVNQLDVNGQLQISKTLVIAPTSAPTAPTLGQIYFDKATSAPYYYNGSSFVSLSPQTVSSVGGATGAISVGGGLNVVNSTIINSGVTSLQGQSGDVNFTSGSGIKVNGTTISNTGILSVSGTPNQISVVNNNGDVQVSLSGVQNGGVIIGSGGGLATIKPTAVGQCLISDSSSLPVFGACTSTSMVQSIQVGSNTLSGALQLQATGGLAVSNSGNVITIDGSGIVAGGDVSFGATHTAGHVTALDGSGDLISTDLINQSGGLQVASSGYYLDLANAGTSTFTIKNTNASNVANLAVTGTTQSSGLRDASGNLYGFAVSPTGSSRTVCYVDNTNASNCPTGGNVSYGASHNPNTIAALDGSGNLINSDLNVVAGGLQVVASSYSLDVKDANNSTLTVKNSTAGKAANLVVTGTITAAGLLNGSDTYTLPTNGGNGGVLCYLYAGSSNCPTGGNVSTTGTPTNGNLAVFTGTNTIGNSIISDNGSLVTIGGNLAANAITAQSLQSAGALTISAAGSLTIGSTSQVLALQGNGTSTLAISSNGHTMTVGFTPLTTADRAINFPNESGTVCLQGSVACGFAGGGSGVTSLNGLTGALTLNNASGSGSAITINNATTAAKGIASFDATDFTVASGVVSTIQPIGLASAVQFGSLTLGTGDLTLSAGHTVHADNLSSVGANLTISSGSGAITFVTDSGANSFIFPTYGGTGQMICTIATTCAGGAGSAVILEPGTGSTSQVQSATTDRNAIFVNKASGLGNLIQLQAGGSDAFVIDGSGNTTISNTVHATGNVTVDGTLTTDTIASTGALTIGSASKQFVLQGNGSSTISATASGNTTTLGFTTPTGNNSILFPDAGGTVCLSLPINNCAFAAGGSGISGSGTVGKIAKFTGTSAVGDSLLSETGSIVTVGGSLAVGVSSSINGTVIVRNSTNANTITIQQAAAPGSNLTLKLPTQSGTFAVAATGPLSLDVNTGQLSCATCLTSGGGGGSSGVVSVDGLTGTLNINNTSGSGSTITIDDAAADGTTKGIATFNATNFTASGGVINTIQDIATTSSPTFANLSLQGATGLTVGSASNLGQVLFKDGTNDGFTSTFSPATLTANRILTIPNAAGTLAVSASGNLSLSALGNLTISNSPTFSTSVSTPLLQSTGTLSITPGGALTVGSTGQSLALQGNGSTTLSSTVSGNTTTVGFTTPTAARSILFPDAGGTVCLSLPTNNCGFAAGGSGVTSLNGLAGVLSVANATGSGGTITINNAAADGSTKGIAAFNSTNFTASSGVVNTVQNINTGASPSFTGLTVSGLTDGIVQSTSGVLSGGAVDRNSSTLLSNALNVSNGGTGTNTFAANGILYGNGTSALQVTSAAANSILATNGSNVPGLTQVLPTAVQGNITSTGVLAAGSIASGFGTIVTANNITTSATVQGGNVNATSALQLGGANINTAGTLNNVAYLNQANSFSAANTFTSTVAIQGGLTLGVVGTTAGSLTLATTTSGVSVSITAAPRAASVALTIPTDTNTTDIICLQLKGNCSTAAGAYIANSTAQQTNATFNIQAGSGNVAAKIQGASGQDVVDFYVAGNGTPIAKIDSTGLLTATKGLTANGAGVSLNDSSNFNTSINGGTSTGTVTIGNTAAQAISITSGTSITLDGVGATTYGLGASTTSGTINIGGTAQTGALTLGQSTDNNTVNIANGTIATGKTGTINIGTNATGTGKTVTTIGSNNDASSVTLQGGTAGILLSSAGGGSNAGVLIKAVSDTTAALQVQNASGVNILQVDTTIDATNLVTNGSFETNTTGWAAVNNGGTSTISRITTQQYAGTASLQVVTSGTATNAGVSYPITLSNSTSYALSFLVKGSSSITDLVAGYSSTGLVAGQSNCTLSPSSPTIVTTGWTRVTCVFTTAASHSGTPYIYISQSGATGHTMYIDAVRLELASASSNYRDSNITLNGAITSATLFQNTNDSTTAFQIQNAAGTSNLFVANTINNKIGIGMSPLSSGEVLQTTSFNASSYVTSPTVIANNYNKNYTIGATGTTANDVVVIDSTNPARAVTSTTPRDPRVLGVSVSTVASGNTGQIVIAGSYTVNADASCVGCSAITIGGQLVVSPTTGRVTQDNNATTGILGIAQTPLASGTGTVSVLLHIVNGQYAPRFQNATDSTTAFQVQNAAGTNIFNVDTSNGIVGTAATTTASSNSSALILQSGNASGATSNSGSVTLDSGTATGTAGSVSVGTGAYAHNVTVGNSTGNTTLSLQGGTGGINIGTTGVANTIQIGNTSGAVTQAINIGTNATASSVTNLTLGSLIGTSLTTIQSGTAGVLVKGAASTVALQIQNAAAKAVATFDTSNGKLILGDQSSSGVTGTLVFNTSNNANAITIQSGATTSGGYTLTLPTALGGTNQCLTTGTVTAAQLQFQNCNITTAFVNGGNSFGGLTEIGTNDANSLNFRTNNTDKLALDTSGNLQFLQASTLSVATAATGTQLTIKGGDANSGTNVGGNLLLQGGAGNSTGASGSVIVKSNTNNSTTAFQVQNAAGAALFTADTSNSRISVGTKGTATAQLYVAGQTPTAVLGQANGQAASYGLAITGRYAYITPTGSTKGIQVFDISNPAAPVQVGNGVTTTSSSAKRVKIQGKYAYVAGGGFLQVFDISNPALPVSLGSQTYSAGTNTPSLYVQGRYAYVGESTTPTLYVFDISNPASIPTATSLAIASSGNGAADMYGQGRYLYLANGGTNSFQVIDIANPGAPSLVNGSALTVTGTALSVTVQGRYAYVGTTSSVAVVDVSVPATPSVATTVSLSGAAHALSAQSRYLYAGDATNSVIRTLDISTPASATLIAGTVAAQSPLAMASAGRYLYASNNSATNTIQSFDMGGSYEQQLEAGGIETDTLSVRGNTNFASDVAIQGALGVGSGLQVAGNVGFNTTATSGTGFNVTANSLTSGNAQAITSSAGGLSVTTTGATSTALAVTADSQTSGNILSVSSASGSLASGSLANISQSATYTTSSDAANLLNVSRSLVSNIASPGSLALQNSSITAGVTNGNSIAFNAGTNTSKALVVTVTLNAIGQTPTLTYNGISLGSAIVSTNNGSNQAVFIYVLANNQVANNSNSLVVSGLGAGTATVIAEAWNNANQTTPVNSSITKNTDSGTSGSVTVPSTASGHVVVDVVATNGSSGTLSTTQSGQTSIQQATGPYTGSSQRPGSSGSTIGWQEFGGTWTWIQAAVDLNPAGAPSLAITGAVASFSSTCSTPGSSGCTDSSNILSLSQQYATATGAVLNVQNAGLGNGGVISNTNSANTSAALVLQNQGTGAALSIQSQNSGVDILVGSSTTGQIQTSGGTTSNGLNLQSGVATAGASGGVALQSGAGTSATGTASLLSGNASAGTSGAISVTSGTGTTGTGAVTVSSGTASSGTSGTLTVASGTGTTSTGALSVKSGNASAGASGALTVGTGTGTTGTGGLTISTGNSSTSGGTSGAISIDTGTTNAGTAGNITIGTGAYAHNTTIGNTTGNSTVTLQGGTGGVLAKSANSTTSFQIQNAASTSLFTVDTTNNVITLNSQAGGALTTWATGNNSGLPARSSHGTVVANGYVYVVGGRTVVNGGSEVDFNTVYFAKLNADGTVGNWSQTSANLGSGNQRIATAVVYANGYIYVMGGSTAQSGGSNIKNTVFYGKVGANGDVSSWNTTGTLQTATFYAAGAYANGYIYNVGGTGTGGGSQSTVQYAKINADGSLPNFSTTTALPQSRDSHGVIISGNYMYVLGGETSGVSQTNVYYNTISPTTGQAGATWSNQAGSIPYSNESFGYAAVNGYIYAAGGWLNASSQTNKFYYAPIPVGGGALGTWVDATSTNPLPANRGDVGLVTANGYLYAINGTDANNTAQTSVYAASTGRVRVSGALDLVGYASGGTNDLPDDNTSNSGALLAGNTRIFGTLDVQGAANFVQNVSIGGNLNIGGTLTVTGAVNFSSTLAVAGVATFNGHIATGNTTGNTTGAVNANAGTGGSPACSVNGDDTAGQITLTTGTASWATGVQCTITFAQSFSGSAPTPVITAANSTDITAVKPYVDVPGSSPFTTWTLNFNTADTAQHTFKFNYFNAQ